MDAPGTDFKPSSNGTKPLLVAIVILAIFVAGSLAYLGFTKGLGDLPGLSRPKPTLGPNPAIERLLEQSQITDVEVKSFRLAKQVVDDYSGSKLLVESNLKKNQIVHVFRGQLTAMDAGSSWTVEKGDKRIILHSTPEVQVKYTRESQTIDAGQLKIGDTVTIRAAIDLDKGVLYVKSINIRVQQSSVQTPAPSPQQAQ